MSRADDDPSGLVSENARLTLWLAMIGSAAATAAVTHEQIANACSAALAGKRDGPELMALTDNVVPFIRSKGQAQ